MMSSSPNSSASEHSARCIDTTSADSTYQAAKLLAADWSLTWTERIIDDSPSSLPYGHRLLQLLQLWDERFFLAFAVPDPEFGCLKSMPLDNPEEVQTARGFLLALARQVTKRLGATAPYELYLHYNPMPKPPPHWARAAAEHQGPFAEGLPKEVQQCVRDGQWTRLYLVQAPAETIAKSYNYWRMRKNADPIDYDTVYQQAEQWKNIILHQPPPPVVMRSRPTIATDDTMRVSPMHRLTPKKRSRSPDENPTSSSSSNGLQHEESTVSAAPASDQKRPRREKNRVERALQFVVPQQCLAYATDSNVELSSILQQGGEEDNDTAESLVNDILSWRRALFDNQKAQDEEYSRKYVTRDVAVWRQVVQAVLRGMELLVLGTENADENDEESALLAYFFTACKVPSSFHSYLTERWQCKSCAGFGKLDPVAVESGFVAWQQETQKKQQISTMKEQNSGSKEQQKEVANEGNSGPKSFIEWQREKHQERFKEEQNRDATRTILDQAAVRVTPLQEQVFSLYSAVQLAGEGSTKIC